jgi:hypothetical protein
MLASSLPGASLEWQALDDPIGAWGLTLDGDLIGEFSWSRDREGVRVELGPEIWQLGLEGTFLIRGMATRVGSRTPQLLYAGNLRQGMALCREGRHFMLISHVDPGVGQWTGFDDSEGNGVVRVRVKVGGGRIWSEVSVAPGGAHRDFTERLLVLWGGLQILRHRQPWLSLTAAFARTAGNERVLRRLARDVSP